MRNLRSLMATAAVAVFAAGALQAQDFGGGAAANGFATPYDPGLGAPLPPSVDLQGGPVIGAQPAQYVFNRGRVDRGFDPRFQGGRGFQQQTAFFRRPRLNGFQVAACRRNAQFCNGRLGAQVFCQTQGFNRAIGWDVTRRGRNVISPVTGQFRTRFDNCQALRRVTCAF
ncbi:MAG: hypothetical protein ACFB2Z_15100 [Maricaulaceae bacterium]